MSEKLINNLRELSRSIRENCSRVETKLSAGGSKHADKAIVTSAAKYHEALERLAKE